MLTKAEEMNRLTRQCQDSRLDLEYKEIMANIKMTAERGFFCMFYTPEDESSIQRIITLLREDGFQVDIIDDNSLMIDWV